MWLGVLLCCVSSEAISQDSHYFNDNNSLLATAQQYYDMDLHGQAMATAQAYLSATDAVHHERTSDYRDVQAASIYHLAAMHLEVPQAESEMVTFVNDHKGNPHVTDAIFALANYYYNEKQYENSITYFDRIDIDMLEEERMSELVFKKGYCHFVRKEFQRAQYEFSYSKDIQNKYFYPINYYHGMCQYFSDNYDGAISSFQRVEGSSVYSKHMPYYITQIYFAEKKYDKLISYGEKSVQQPGTRKVPEIRQLLGQTYFLRGDYERALPHLEAYEAETPTLTVQEFYQLAFTQYKLGLYAKAKDHFLEINREDTELGQLVNYYLADCYINTGDKASARAAFKQASQMNYSRSMMEEATFNYGKLSSELGYEREAINVLLAVQQASPYYDESQVIINDILVNSADYDNALSIMESLPALTEQLKGTYQNIAFQKAIQVLAEGKDDEAYTYLTKSDTYPKDEATSAQSAYWKGYITMTAGDHAGSLAHYDEYFQLQSDNQDLPEESALYMANYNQGYNHLKLEEYYFAVDQFQFAIDRILKAAPRLQNTSITERVLPDAYIRAGDCLFKERRYSQAKEYYDGAIASKKGAYVYALFQRALIEGLERDNYAKIITLETIIDDHPTSDYADDALLQLGDTYLNTQNPGPAADVYNKLIAKYQGKSSLVNSAYLKLGLITYNEGDVNLALDYYKRVFANNPSPTESQEALIAIEEIYIDDLARGDQFIAFVDSLPGYEVNAYQRDSLTYKAGENKYNNAEYDEAITAFDSYLKKYSQGYYRLNAHYYRGESRALKKRYNPALADYEAIIAEGISDFYERSLKKAAIISYNYTQNFGKALKYYKLLETQTANADDKFLAQLGAMRSAFRLGRDAEVQTYANLVNKNGLSTTAEKSTAMYYLGKTAYKNSELDKAITALQQTAQLSTNNQAAEARYLIAQAYYDKGEAAKAEAQVSKANEQNTAYPYWIAKSLLLMSDIFLDRDDLLNARAAAEAVQENFKEDESLLAEANAQLQAISGKESDSNRIKTETTDGTLELDTTGN